MYSAAGSIAKKRTMPATSLDFPSLPNGIAFLIPSKSSFSVMSLSMNPGQTALTVTPRAANSFALALVRPRTPPLAAA